MESWSNHEYNVILAYGELHRGSKFISNILGILASLKRDFSFLLLVFYRQLISMENVLFEQ